MLVVCILRFYDINYWHIAYNVCGLIMYVDSIDPIIKFICVGYTSMLVTLKFMGTTHKGIYQLV